MHVVVDTQGCLADSVVATNLPVHDPLVVDLLWIEVALDCPAPADRTGGETVQVGDGADVADVVTGLQVAARLWG